MKSNMIKKETPELIIEAKDISKLYNKDEDEKLVINILNLIKKKDIGLSKISMDIIKGQILGIIGDEKSGKTTLLKILSGAIRPSSGSIYFDGIKVNVEYIDSLVSYISKDKICCQQYNCTLFENVIQYASRGKIKRFGAVDLCEDLIKEFGMSEYKYKEVLKLPSNIRKRMFIVRGLLSHKPVICFDEPLNYLDGEYKDKFLKKVLDLSRDKNKTIIISSKIKEDIEKICDKIINI